MVLLLTTLVFECVDDLGYHFDVEYIGENYQNIVDTLDHKGYNPWLPITQGIFVPARLIELHYNGNSEERILTFNEFKHLGRPFYLIGQ